MVKPCTEFKQTTIVVENYRKAEKLILSTAKRLGCETFTSVTERCIGLGYEDEFFYRTEDTEKQSPIMAIRRTGDIVQFEIITLD